MFRIRFHGRGGQGMKTASRILGSAAFHAGYVVQDSPIYGAERRGAPMAAFVRMGHEPMYERGLLQQPDLVIVADDTLLGDPAAQPLSGCDTASVVLINSRKNAVRLRQQYPAVPERLLTADFTALAFAHTQALSSLSTALGVASARLVGLPWPHVEAGLTQELADSLTSDQWHRNMALAQATSTMTAAWQPLEERETSAVHTSASIAEVTLSLRAHTQRGSDEPDSASGRLLLGNGTRDRWCGAVVQAPHVTSIQHTESLACYKRSVLFISSPMGANDPSVCRSPAAKREDLRLRSWDPYRIPPLAVTLSYL
jgi:2-oxoacid:acceptor oxidoreductase gamma subunit (pyruvate/2-ketoisovalerate family)